MMGRVVHSALTGSAAPWMLGSDEIYRHPRLMLRLGPRFIERRDSTPDLGNLLQGNTRAIRMLKAWGFSIREEVILSAGVEFLKSEMD